MTYFLSRFFYLFTWKHITGEVVLMY